MSKTLIACFSHAGQNYSHGGIRNLAVGNTEVVARKINELIPSDLFHIDTVKKYPDDHMQKIKIAKREFEQGARPELTARVGNTSDYDTVIVAYPNWWTTMPMAVCTFLEGYDWAGKTVCPLITHRAAASPTRSRTSGTAVPAPSSPRASPSTATTPRPATRTWSGGSTRLVCCNRGIGRLLKRKYL